MLLWGGIGMRKLGKRWGRRWYWCWCLVNGLFMGGGVIERS